MDLGFRIGVGQGLLCGLLVGWCYDLGSWVWGVFCLWLGLGFWLVGILDCLCGWFWLVE